MTRQPARAALRFAGLARDRLGIALWQADGSGPEPAATGHTFTTPLGPITAHYYIASRDYDRIDPGARGAAACLGPDRGWPALAAALAAHGRAYADLVVRVPLTSAGAAREGEDWVYRDDVETRHLRPQAPLVLALADAPMLALPAERLTLTEDYRGATRFADVRLSLVSSPVAVQSLPAAPAVAREIARAFLADLAGAPLRLVVASIRLLPETFAGAGRLGGRFAEIPGARLEPLDR